MNNDWLKLRFFFFFFFRFLIQCLEDLDESLKKLNSSLFVIRGQPADVLSRFIVVSLFFFFFMSKKSETEP